MESMRLFSSRTETPLGPMDILASDEALLLLEFADRPDLAKQSTDLQSLVSGSIEEGTNDVIEQTKEELREYFAGRRKRFSVPLRTPGTPFQESVWKVLREIPYGETWSYGTLARRLGDPKTIRAAAHANGRNRIAIIVPCHRVIGTDGSLTGYAGGTERKKRLLELEGATAPVPEGQETLF